MIIVSDTSILSNFYIINELDLLRRTLGHLIIPRKVFQELEMLANFGHDTRIFQKLEWLEIRDASNQKAVSNLVRKLDPGEAEAIILANELHADFLLMDDHKGRVYAESLGFKVIGCAGILLRVKLEGHISLVRPYLDQMIKRANFWLNREVYQKTLQLANE